VKTGVWLMALGNGDQHRPMGRKAREELYIFFTLKGRDIRRKEKKVHGKGEGRQ